jgi:hypothetical protein
MEHEGNSQSAPKTPEKIVPDDSKSGVTMQNTFEPRGIHHSETQDFWRHELKAGDWVMDVIDRGYVIPLNDLPSNYEEENNGLARKNMEFVRKMVRELREKGVVKFVDKKTKCVSPLAVAEQERPCGKRKLRLCLDASRCINHLLQRQKVALSHLNKALEMTKEGDFQVKYDLTSAYHHINISDSQTGYLGAAFTKEDGSKQYFVFLYLPFGLGSAVHCMAKLFKPLNAYLHSLGI